MRMRGFLLSYGLWAYPGQVPDSTSTTQHQAKPYKGTLDLKKILFYLKDTDHNSVNTPCQWLSNYPFYGRFTVEKLISICFPLHFTGILQTFYCQDYCISYLTLSRVSLQSFNGQNDAVQKDGYDIIIVKAQLNLNLSWSLT